MQYTQSVDSDYNSDMYGIELRLTLHFTAGSLVITPDNYLIDADWIDEDGASSSGPIGNITSGELAFSLYNVDNLFTPNNETGPYFSELKKGLKVTVEIRLVSYSEEFEFLWDPVGIYYVSEWNATITSMTVDVIANDRLQTIFDATFKEIDVKVNYSYYKYLDALFLAQGYPAVVDASLTDKMVYAHCAGDSQKVFSKILVAAMATCVCENDVIKVASLVKSRELRATLYDYDQLVKVALKQQINMTHEDTAVIYNIPVLSDVEEILYRRDLVFKPGTHEEKNVAFSHLPLFKLHSVRTKCGGPFLHMERYSSTSTKLTYEITNREELDIEGDLSAYGVYIKRVEKTLETEVPQGEEQTTRKVLTIDNDLIQSDDYAAKYRLFLDRFVNAKVPIVELQLKGNPLLRLGDKIKIVSAVWDVEYTGIIRKLRYTYNGNIHCDCTLFDASILEG